MQPITLPAEERHCVVSTWKSVKVGDEGLGYLIVAEDEKGMHGEGRYSTSKE